MYVVTFDSLFIAFKGAQVNTTWPLQQSSAPAAHDQTADSRKLCMLQVITALREMEPKASSICNQNDRLPIMF